MPRHRHIEGLEAARLANEKREPVSLLPSQSEERQLEKPRSPSVNEIGKTAPPRLGKLAGAAMSSWRPKQSCKSTKPLSDRSSGKPFPTSSSTRC